MAITGGICPRYRGWLKLSGHADPPSVLMIVWGILTEQSIGQIFAAGVLPGLLLTTLFVIYVFLRAIMNPDLVGGGAAQLNTSDASDPADVVSTGQFLISLTGIVLVIVAVLGGIWFGVFTPRKAPVLGRL